MRRNLENQHLLFSTELQFSSCRLRSFISSMRSREEKPLPLWISRRGVARQLTCRSGAFRLPEPVLGINFRRDDMDKDEWLSLVAAHSNAWLLSVAFYLGAKAGFDKADRNRIFNLINNLPTLFEVVIGKSSVSNQKEEEDVVDEEIDGSGEILCDACSCTSPSDDFWICCDSCEKWFHGECVKLTPGMPDHIKYYQCASRSNKTAPA